VYRIPEVEDLKFSKKSVQLVTEVADNAEIHNIKDIEHLAHVHEIARIAGLIDLKPPAPFLSLPLSIDTASSDTNAARVGVGLIRADLNA
jgi:hypothetical protein